MIEAFNLIPALTFPDVFYVLLFLVLCIEIGGLLSRIRCSATITLSGLATSILTGWPEALKHAEAAVKADNSKAIVEHADKAKTHAKAADEHLDAGLTSLNDAIDHAKMKHVDLAKKSAEEAVTHLKAAQ